MAAFCIAPRVWQCALAVSEPCEHFIYQVIVRDPASAAGETADWEITAEITNEVLPAVNKALQQLQADLGSGLGPQNGQVGRRPDAGFAAPNVPAGRR